MRGINQITLIGRLGRDPELRVGAASGRKVATLSIATNRSYKRDDQWVENTDWHKVKCFDRLAEQVLSLHKGDAVGVQGTLVYDKWTDASGNSRMHAVIRANQVEFIRAPQAQSQGRLPVSPAGSNPEAIEHV
ncbi:MAG: single-stranded DNA-binding protein [Deltaproteobacteria bacterium]|nr:MAG: single-stranded DNA-binding protein [Deltaproteobacteria bacterium]